MITKNFPVTLGASLFSLALVKTNNKVQTRLNNFKYFHIFLYVFASYVKGRAINQISKTNPLH